MLGDAFVCQDARFVSYRRSDFEPEISDHWYVASQLWADVALAQLLNTLSPPDWDPITARCYLEKTDTFLDRQWDYAGGGGYFPRSNPTGTSVESTVRFVDDNALTGLVLLDLVQITDDPARKQQYLHATRRQAELLMTGSVWDSQFGGGFWWNTTRGASAEGKPAQSNALAALFFGRLYRATGDEQYRDWALRTLLWLDTILYDPAAHLYRWSVAYQDVDARRGAEVHQRFANYDQSIAIQAQLVGMQLDGDRNRLARAIAVGEALQTRFWVPERGYRLNADLDQIYTSYGAWSSLGHLALYDATGDERWLDWPRANLVALDGWLREPDGGYGVQTFRCAGHLAQYCQAGQTGWIVDHIRDGAAQAWAQHLQAQLASRLAQPFPVEGR